MATRTLLYDLGNVLVYFSHERMFEQIGRVCGRSGAQVRDFLAQGLMLACEEGRIGDDRFHAEIERWAGRAVDPRDLRRAGADIFWPNDAMIEVLQRVRSTGRRLVLLSNTSSAHVDFVRERWGVLDAFDACVLSFEVGATKPKREIFEAALARIDCEPAECFYTDDVAPYVEAARALGFDAEVFVDAQTHVRQLQARGVL
jgi:putative hydrolase of the HAD superfamily